MRIAYVTNLPGIIHGIEDVNTETTTIERPKDNEKPNLTPDTQLISDVSAVPYKPTESRDTQMERNNPVQDDDIRKHTQNWREEVTLLNKFFTYRNDFIEMLAEPQTMWNGHLGHINVAKHRFKLLHGNTQPFHSASYRAGPNAREFEKSDRYLLCVR